MEVSTRIVLPFMDATEDWGEQKYLVYGGKTGWIGIMLVDLLKAQGKEVVAAESRIENITDVSKVLVM